MVILTRKTDYALVAMTHLGQALGRGQSVCSAREISDQYRIPLSILMNVLKTLNREGLVFSVRGSRGGYRLARDPKEISLAEIVAAIEGPMRLVQCSGSSEHSDSRACELSEGCPVRAPVRVLQEELKKFFRKITLASFLERSLGAAGHPVLLQTASLG